MSTGAGEIGTTQRGASRRSAMLLGTIVLDSGETIACVMRDHSAGGAKLSVSRRHRLPERFVLVVQGRTHAFTVRRAWQRGDAAGIAVCGIAPRTPLTTALPRSP